MAHNGIDECDTHISANHTNKHRHSVLCTLLFVCAIIANVPYTEFNRNVATLCVQCGSFEILFRVTWNEFDQIDVKIKSETGW